MNTRSQIFSFSNLKSFTEKIFLTFCFFLITLQVLAQFTDNFSDGEFTTGPVWNGNNTKFSASTQQLQLVAPAVAETAYLSTTSGAINNATWEFFIQLDFNPSSTNYARVYLVSDKLDLSGALNGYYVMLGNTADEISLYKQTGSTRTKIIDGLDGRVNLATVTAKVKVTRDAQGNWELLSDVGATENYISEGMVNDAEHFSSQYFGVFCNYTATRSTLFYFDDFIITGNSYEPPKPPTYKDVIIAEIFADPTPKVDLPEGEFIELYNRSTTSFNVGGWKFTDGSSTATLGSYTLDPNSYLIVTSSSSLLDFFAYSNVIGVSGFPSLNNSGDSLVLKYFDESVIDVVKYADAWYKSDEKKAGGWSLELIDINNPCGEGDNWIASENTLGGTPGKQNSVFANKPDLAGPKLLSAITLDSVHLKLIFNEKLSSVLPAPTDFQINPVTEIESVGFGDYNLTSLLIESKIPFKKKVLYTIVMQNVQDCNGNLISDEFSSAEFALTESATSMDVVVNEILFNPRPTGVDFVEIVNTSAKFINLKNWSLANDDQRIITTQDYLLKPGSYCVLTNDGDIVKGEYALSREEFFLETSLPSFNDDEGSAILLSEKGEMIDSITYSKSMHSVFIKDEEGISLERISFYQPTAENQNWKSASSIVGFATPGYLNSNARSENEIPDESVKVNPEIFIPITGQPDFTQIQFAFDQGGYVANIKIIDSQGHVVRELANNEVLGTEGILRWDGDRDDGNKARVGYYMVWFEVFDAKGAVKTFRKRVVVAGKF